MSNKKGSPNSPRNSPEPTEETPLLQGAESARPPGNIIDVVELSSGTRPIAPIAPIAPLAPIDPIDPILSNVPVAKASNRNSILHLLCLIFFIAASASGFAAVPLTMLVEDVVCSRYYDPRCERGGPSNKKNCKVESIQTEVAVIFAITGMCEAAVGFFAAFPWGIIANKVGRKPIFSTALVGMALSVLFTMIILRFPGVFPTMLIALDSAFFLIGGGTAVVWGILLSTISDTFPTEKRATAFMKLQASGLIGNLVSPALSSAMMVATGPWPVMFVAFGCLVLAAMGFLVVPEAYPHEEIRDSEIDHTNEFSGLKGTLMRILNEITISISMFKSPPLLLLLATCFLMTPFTAAILQFLVQFVSKRYNVPIRDTGYIQSIYGFAQIIQALQGLPWVSHLLLRDTMPKRIRMSNERERDLYLAKYSFYFVFLGFSILGVAPNIIGFVLGLLVLALGSGYRSLTHSLMGLFVDSQHQTNLYALVGMIDVLGSLFGSPMLAGLFTWGMRLGGGWIGLPYYGLCVLSAFCIGLVTFVKVPEISSSNDIFGQSEEPE